jgi:hypothetical protein
MADIRIMRTSGTSVPTGAQLFPGQMAVNEERLYVGLYNSLDEAAAPYGIAMIDKANEFKDNIDVLSADVKRIKVTCSGGNYGAVELQGSGNILVSGGGNGVKITSGSMEPSVTETGTVGDSSYIWADGYFKALHLTGTITDNTQAVTKEWVLAQLSAQDVMVFKGTLGTGGTVTALPTADYSAGWTYRVITAGYYAGQAAEVGDLIICVKDYATGFLNSDWSVQQANIDGAVVGPASSATGRIALFDGATGKLLTNDNSLWYDTGSDILYAGTYSGAWGGSAIGVGYGGTNLTSYAVGDIIYASGATTLSKLADVATGNALISGGVGAAPSWGKIGLTTHVSGVLPAANGGTGQSSYTVGDILYASGSTAISKLADIATGNVLLSGGVGAAPAYGKVGLTTHITGTLAIANGGTGKTSIAANAMWYGSAANVLSEIATTAFGRSLLAAVSGTTFAGLKAQYAATADYLDVATDTGSTPRYLVMAGGIAGAYGGKANSGLKFTPSTGTLEATKFEGLIDCGTWTA